MSINTLKIYKDCLNAGFTEEQAVVCAQNADSLINNIKDEFASNKTVAGFGTVIIIIGGIIATIGGFTLDKVVDLDKRVAVVESTINLIRE